MNETIIIEFKKISIKRDQDIESFANSGKPYDMDPDSIIMAMNKEYTDYIIVHDNTEWVLPKGAYGKSCGPS